MCIELYSSIHGFPILWVSYVEDTFSPLVSSIDSFVTQRYMSTYGVLPSPSINNCIFLSPGNIPLVCCHSNGSDKKGRALYRRAYWFPAS